MFSVFVITKTTKPITPIWLIPIWDLKWILCLVLFKQQKQQTKRQPHVGILHEVSNVFVMAKRISVGKSAYYISAGNLNDHIKSKHVMWSKTVISVGKSTYLLVIWMSISKVYIVMWVKMCDFCGKDGISAAELNEHIKSKHSYVEWKCANSVRKSTDLPVSRMSISKIPTVGWRENLWMLCNIDHICQ